MRNYSHKIILLLTALLLLCGISGCQKKTPFDPGPPPKTDPALAYRFAEEQVKLGPRPSGRNEAAQRWLNNRFAETGKVFVEPHTFRENGVAYYNQLAWYPSKSERFVIVAAHYDTKVLPLAPDFQGANDGASGVAALLAMVHALPEDVDQYKLPFGLLFVCFDGEEALREYSDTDGLHGSRALAEILKKNGQDKNCVAMILLDMVGDKNLDVRFPADTTPWLKDLAAQTAVRLGIQKQFAPGGPVMLDDHVPFQKIGIPVIDLIDFNFGPGNAFWHTAQDSLDKISGESIAASADFAFQLIWAIARRDRELSK